MKPIAERSLDRVRSALASGEKRAALAMEIGISEGQLSKLINGDLTRLCEIAAALGLEIVPTDYIASIERILKEKL